MGLTCKHKVRPYYDEYYKRFVAPPSEPPTQQIQHAKLYLCPECRKWFSLIGAVLRPPLIIEEDK